ncbi:MAG: DEAD/DEAH box helicase [Ruminococcus sp.]|nr:DEAD/DEAH box helicase [Ruminococcus sp.]
MRAVFRNNRIFIYDSFIHKEGIKQISGRLWHPEEKAWSVPVGADSLETLDLLGCKFSDELRDLKRKLIQKKTADNQVLIPAPLKVTPYEHQLRGYNLACRSMGIIGETFVSPGFALLMEMGTGKTITSIAVAGRAYLSGKIKRLLILAPKSIVSVWDEEFQKFADFQYSLSVLQGLSEKKVAALKAIHHKGLEVAVVNYDSIALIEKELLDWNPDFIICDESSKIKNPTAKMSKSTHRIAKLCKYRLILTGTPIQNNPLDFFSQYKVLDESIFGKSFYAFKNEYAVLGNFNQPIGWRNLAELVKKAHSIAFRVTKEEALDLPETTDIIRSISFEDKVMKMYRKFVKDSYTELSKGEVTATNILTRLLRLQQITGGFLRPDEESDRYEKVSTAKLDALEDIIDTAISENKKLVIIARFIPEITEICKMLESKGIEYAKVCGEVKDRASEVDAFQNNPNCIVFVGQLQTVSMGLTLTAASTMVFYSLSYNYADYSQARARIHRIGQRNICQYIHLVAKDTIDETVLKALEQKENIATKIVDDWRSILK